jgi:hypothetical protein
MAHGKQSHKDETHACPFPDCLRTFTKRYNLKVHLAKVRGTNGDELHLLNDQANWSKAIDEGLLEIQSRPGNLSEGETKARRNNSAKTYRRENKDKIQRQRQDRRKDLQNSAKLAKRCARIAWKQFPSDTIYQQHRQHIFKIIYPPQNRLVGQSWNPQTLLSPTTNASINSFLMLVTIYIPPSKWPKVITFTEQQIAQQANDNITFPILAQMPGKKEYKALQQLLHPDRAPSRRTRQNCHLENADGARSLGLSHLNPLSDDVIAPFAGHSKLLNDSYSLYTPIITNVNIQNEVFVWNHDNDPTQAQTFAAKSNAHKQLIDAYDLWIAISSELLSMMTPVGYSFAQIHHFINVSIDEPDSLEDQDLEKWELDENDEIGALTDFQVLQRVRTLKAVKKGGRRLDSDEDEEEDKEEDEEEESG